MTHAARAHMQRLGLRLIAARHRAIRHLLASRQRQAPVTAGNLKQEETLLAENWYTEDGFRLTLVDTTPGGASRPVYKELS